MSKIKKYFKKSILAFLTLVLFCGELSADNQIIKAMRDELNRSVASLQVEKLDKPYYVEYILTIQEPTNVRASLGAMIERDSRKSARLTVNVRVGNYNFDNTNFFDFGFSFFGSGDDEENFRNRTVPIELDYSTLRRELWLATDAAYKQAAEVYAKKEAVLKNRVRRDTTYDFIELKPEKLYDTIKSPNFDIVKFSNTVERTSAIFREFSEINVSSVNIEFIPQTIYYANSEGREYIKTDFFTGFEAVAFTQSDEGMPLANFYSAYSQNPDLLPGTDSLIKGVRHLALTLSALKNTKPLDEPYTGPILFEQQAAAELFAQIFAPNFVAQRASLTEAGTQDGGRFASFQNKIGGRVLPEFLSVKADPSIKKYASTELLGTYRIDDQGVKSQSVDLVIDGYLKNLLSTRTPTRRVRTTNGHYRGGSGMLSNIFITPDKENNRNISELKNKLIQLCKDRELPFGIIVRKAMNQNIMFTSLFRLALGAYQTPRGDGKISLIETYKIYPDGREELVRGCEGNGFSVQSFKDIIMSSDRFYALNYLAPSIVSSFMTGGSQYTGASIVVPDLLFEDAEVKSIDDDFPKPPIITSPLKK